MPAAFQMCSSVLRHALRHEMQAWLCFSSQQYTSDASANKNSCRILQVLACSASLSRFSSPSQVISRPLSGQGDVSLAHKALLDNIRLLPHWPFYRAQDKAARMVSCCQRVKLLHLGLLL